MVKGPAQWSSSCLFIKRPDLFSSVVLNQCTIVDIECKREHSYEAPTHIFVNCFARVDHD
jgi:hypothetical protein